MEANIKLLQAHDIREFITDSNTRRIGMLYFQRTGQCDMVARVISADTDGEWLRKMINDGKIYRCEERIICEAC